MNTFTRYALGLLLFATGCTPDPKSGKGFTLPEGDPDQGRETFVQLHCHACHTVSGVEFEPLENSQEKMVALGGTTSYVRTYGDLVTSIINPSHRFALGYAEEDIKQDEQSKMRVYNDEMTVTQLINLVAFLQKHYELKKYEPSHYRPYH